MTQKILLLACGILSLGILSDIQAKEYSCDATGEFDSKKIRFESARIDSSEHELVCNYTMPNNQDEKITVYQFLPKGQKCKFKSACSTGKKCTVTCK